MNSLHTGMNKPCPDVARLIDHLKGNHTLSVPPLMEFLVDDIAIKRVLEQVFDRPWVSPGPDRASQTAYLDNVIFFWRELGYDYVRLEMALPFPSRSVSTENTASSNGEQRSWVDESHGWITSWDDLETYPFPDVKNFDFFAFEYLTSHMPEGMGLIASHGGGIMERTSWILSMENLCYLLADDPALVKAVVDRIGNLQLKFYEQILDLPNIAAIFPGDDMGFRTATLISPRDLRRYFLPWHKRIAEKVHQKGLPYFLHSCGNLRRIMDDLIDDVHIDGKHSYEDAIMPVEEFYSIYAERIAVIGGMDMHFLSTAAPDAVRNKVRQLVRDCSSKGRYAIGSGNSIADYVPLENFMALVSEVNKLKEADARGINDL